MRIIKFLFSFMILVGVLAGVSFLVGREILLVMGVSQIKSSISKMRTIASQTSSYYQECRRKGSGLDSDIVIQTIQLRFTSENEYVVEVICAQFSFEPIIVESRKLPPLVAKKVGSGGIIWGEEISALTLTLWGRSSEVGIANTKTISGKPGVLMGSISPITTCQGYGFECCQGETSSGVGEQYPEARDCPKSCYTSCQNVPVILSFTTNPFFDPASRKLTIDNQEVVEFHYVLDPNGLDNIMAKIDYQDGQSDEVVSDNTGSFSHQFSCQSAPCVYQVRLSAFSAGSSLVSTATPLSFVEVVVR